MRVLYYLFVAAMAALFFWFLVGRWNPSEIRGLEGLDSPSVTIKLGENGLGKLTREIGGQREVVDVAFGRTEESEIAPVYELRILTSGHILLANSVFNFTADLRGPDVVLCTDCQQPKVFLPSRWQLLRE